MSAFIRRLQAIQDRRKAIVAAVLAAYDLIPEGRVRRLEVAKQVAETMGVSTVSPQFQVDVRTVVVAMGARTVAKGNARFYRGLQRRAKVG